MDLSNVRNIGITRLRSSLKLGASDGQVALNLFSF